MTEQGFYVRKAKYLGSHEEWEGPIDTLGKARDIARGYGPDIEIWHGYILEDGYFEGSIVPKVKKDV